MWALFFALLCLPGLSVPLHGDEAKTYLEHVDSTPSHILFHYAGPNQHSLFSILSNASMRTFGENEIAFRLPVFFAAILSVFLIHHLGQRLWNRRVATFASLLMIGSAPHLYWAQHGRGYALTELLALASVFGTILLLEEGSRKNGTSMLIFSGFALCVALPSAAYFLPACGLAFIFVLWNSRNPEALVFWFHLGKKLLPFIFLAVLTAGYFFIIYDDLIWGIETYKSYLKQFKNIDSLAGTPQQFQEVAWNLARPWGLWFYLPVLFGTWTLNKTQRGFFLILLVTPVLLMILSGVHGPPRTYVYLLPFYILLAALGIDRGIGFLCRVTPRYFNKVLPIALGLVFIIPSVFSHAQDHLNKRDIQYATMAESREALRYIQDETTKRDLVVISFDDMALRRTLEPLIAKKMFDVFQSGQLGRIIFLGHHDIPVSRIHSIAGSSTFNLPVSLMKGITDIGNIRIYRMNVKILPLFRQKEDTETFTQWRKKGHPNISLAEINEHKFLGQQSLQIHKTMEENALIYSPLTYQIPSQDGSFILYAEAGKYHQKSEATLFSVRKSLPGIRLNYLFGVYREEGEGLAWERIHPFFMFRRSRHKEPFKWQINFTLIPLSKGRNKIQEAFILREQTSHFDGIHGHLLAPIVEHP